MLVRIIPEETGIVIQDISRLVKTYFRMFFLSHRVRLHVPQGMLKLSLNDLPML